MTRMLAVLTLLVAPWPSLAVDLVYDGVILDQAGTYDAYPSHMLSAGVQRLWFCSDSNETDNDGIFYSAKSGPLGAGGWSAPVEVFNHLDSPWAARHICDPSVVLGDLSYEGNTYRYALYYTGDDNTTPHGVNGQIGAAFSDNGVSWVAHPVPVISTANPPNDTYGAGASGTAWYPAESTLQHVYNDTTTGGPFPVVHKESADGLVFTPTPPNATLIDELARDLHGSAPDVAYSPYEGVWWGNVSNADADGTGLGEVRILRSASDDLLGPWELIAIVDESVTGEQVQHNAGFAKNGDSTLYIDADGWAYLLISTGLDMPNYNSWKIGQVRFRIFPQADQWIVDDFAAIGPRTQDGSQLNGTEVELGARSWEADAGFVFSNGAASIAAASESAVGTVDYFPEPGTQVSAIDGLIDATGSSWTAVGFLGTSGPGLAIDGQIWMFRQGNQIKVRADGTTHLLYAGTPPVLHDGWNRFRIEYEHAQNRVSAYVNWIPVIENFSLSSLGFTPVIGGSTLQINEGTPGQSRCDNLFVNDGDLIFADGFEIGTTERWVEGS